MQLGFDGSQVLITNVRPGVCAVEWERIQGTMAGNDGRERRPGEK
jgi:hypothetical protein